jgi:heme A synthase
MKSTNFSRVNKCLLAIAVICMTIGLLSRILHIEAHLGSALIGTAFFILFAIQLTFVLRLFLSASQKQRIN